MERVEQPLPLGHLLSCCERALELMSCAEFRAAADRPEADLSELVAAGVVPCSPAALRGLHAIESIRRRWRADAFLAEHRLGRYRLLLSEFRTAFGDGPVLLVSSPARIEVVGGHIDYVDYFQDKIIAFASREHDLLMAIRPRRDRLVRARSLNGSFPPAEFSLDEFPPAWTKPPASEAECTEQWVRRLCEAGCPPTHWANYVKAGVFYTAHRCCDRDLGGMDLLVQSTIPVAGGASSSSALVMAAQYGFRVLNHLPRDPVELVETGAVGEWYVGTRGGRMDHATMAFARPNQALLVTFQPFCVDAIASPAAGYQWLTFYTEPAEKSGRVITADNEISAVSCSIIPWFVDRYLQQHPAMKSAWDDFLDAIEREDLQAFDEALQEVDPLFESLPESVSLAELGRLSPDLLGRSLSLYPTLGRAFGADDRLAVRKKARYHVDEVRRVILEADLLRAAAHCQATGDEAGEEAAMADLGRSLTQTHNGLRDLYGVSTQGIETIVRASLAVDGVLGARVMGFGLGGNVLVLTRKASSNALIESVQSHYYTPLGRDGEKERSVHRHTPGPGLAAEDVLETARRRLVALTADPRRWAAHEAEILALACALLGLDRPAEYRPRRPVRPVILASGRGTRFGADRPKVLAEVFGRPAIEWVLETLNRMPSMLPAVIVASDYRGADRMLRSALDGRYPVQYVIEANPHGTGHSVLQTESLLAGFAGTVLVTEGTQAMMQPATLAKSLLIHEAVALASMTIPTTRKQQPYAYLVRNEAGHVVDSRETRLEHAEPIPEGEDNVSLYLVRSEDLFPALHLARERCLDPATGHYHLGQMGFPNEMVRSFQRQGRLVLGLCLADEREAQSIKYPEDVVKIEQHLRELGTVPPSGQAPARTDALADPLAGT